VVIAQAVHESDYGLEAKWRDVYDSVATDFDFMAGIMVGDRHPAAKALIQHLSTPASVQLIKSRGMEPG
jgi:hypothetical protein